MLLHLIVNMCFGLTYPISLFIYVPIYCQELHIIILPENTKYTSADCFTDIERERFFSKSCENICLLGDLNARTGKLKDFVYLM